ncbi:hypothetical protein M6B22_09885 [Jatrophihabitans cynanchi]|uniref:Uncharacterized protein n=1 Tax=Jatrophihabitans cynanchi TaxID=2944128 RepID=A0ABY7K601_9ACTN|nr:hypothetical protein [Jatrophihabitans sp. SB3-54]WAX59047.1 hypothetical protein M6B22_09885 [Jatrophihabitans sp. SB3-54]
MSTHAAPPQARRARVPHALVAAPGAAGLVLVVIGTFLPWLRSGRRLRNSYETDGAIRRLLEPEGIAHTALSVWPVVSLACAVAIALYVFGLRVPAIVLALLIALTAGAVAVGALSAPTIHSVAVAATGPVTTLCGVALILAAVSIRFISFVRDDRRYR